MIGKISQCKHQEEYDLYVKENDIYSTQEDWNVNVALLAKYIRENNLSPCDITEDIIEKFKIA